MTRTSDRSLFIVVLALVLVVVGGCSSSQSSDEDADVQSNVSTIDETAGETDPGDGQGDETDGEAEPDEVEAESAAAEPRFDPLPIPADLAQVEDVYRSLLGPTDDFVTQVRRVVPDFVQLPTPPGAEIVAVRSSYGSSARTSDGERSNAPMVVLTSTMEPEELGALLEAAIATEHPDWQIDSRPTILVVDGPLLRFDLPDVEQAGGDDSPTSELQIIVEPGEAGGSRVSIETRALGPPLQLPDAYSGWQDELPAPTESVRWAAGVLIDSDEGVLRLWTSHTGRQNFADSRDDYVALLTERKLTVDSEEPDPSGRIELSVSGHPEFSNLAIVLGPDLRLTATIDL